MLHDTPFRTSKQNESFNSLCLSFTWVSNASLRLSVGDAQSEEVTRGMLEIFNMTACYASMEKRKEFPANSIFSYATTLSRHSYGSHTHP